MHISLQLYEVFLHTIDIRKDYALYIHVLIEPHIISSNVQNCYSALVILSKWAKPLVRHPDITMLRAISAVLKCSVYDILVLSHQLDNDSLQTYILDMPLTEHSSLYNE